LTTEAFVTGGSGRPVTILAPRRAVELLPRSSLCTPDFIAPEIVASRHHPTGDIKALHQHAALHNWHLDTQVHPNEHLSEEDSQRRAYIAHDDNGAWLVNEGIEDAQNLETCDAIARGRPFGSRPDCALWSSATRRPIYSGSTPYHTPNHGRLCSCRAL
jgi:hypothetical protein